MGSSNASRTEQWLLLAASIGERYHECRLNNYKAKTAEQKKVVEKLYDYCENVLDRVCMQFQGIVLFGPEGTGKDHLLTAVARAAITTGVKVTCVSGVSIYGAFRDGITNRDLEGPMIQKLVAPQVLWISDPIPPIGALTERQSEILYRIIDGRYRRFRPTWVTVNVCSGDEFDNRMSPQVAGRLRDNVLSLFCNWPSYRVPHETV